MKKKYSIHFNFKPRFLSLLAALLLLVYAALLQAEAPWKMYREVTDAGFSKQGIRQLKDFYQSTQSAAFMILVDDRVVVAWGDVNRRFWTHSVRKSLINSLYGIYVNKKAIDLDKNMGQLGITDKTPLSQREKTATIRHLLKSRSGIYLPAAAETAYMKASRPERNSCAPGEQYYYNNWDFNALGTIFHKLTGKNVFQAFHRDIADAIGMEDFRPEDCRFFLEKQYSNHPAYHIKLSCRDLARYGLLYLRKGLWNNKQVVPADWIKWSTTRHSEVKGVGISLGYGCLWWISDIFKDYGLYYALGVRGHYMAVIPKLNMIVVNRTNTYRRHRVNPMELNTLTELAIKAKTGQPKKKATLTDLILPSRLPEKLYQGSTKQNNFTGNYETNWYPIEVKVVNNRLVMENFFGTFNLHRLNKTHFFVENIESILIFSLDKNGKALKAMFTFDKSSII